MVAFGTTCLWWDHASRAHAVQLPTHTEFRCPVCGGVCGLHQSEASFLDMARRFEVIGFVGHRNLMVWSRGKCYRTRKEAWNAYRSWSLVTTTTHRPQGSPLVGV